MLCTLLLLALGVILTSGWKLSTVPMESLGCSNSQRNLICAERFGQHYTFMNQCYFKKAVQSLLYDSPYGTPFTGYNVTDPKNCNYFKDYVYVKFPVCSEVTEKANKQKLVYKQLYNSLIEVIENDFTEFQQRKDSYYSNTYAAINYYKEQISMLNELKVSVNKGDNNTLSWPSKCGVCTEDYSDTFEECVKYDLKSFDRERDKLAEEWRYNKNNYLRPYRDEYYIQRLYIVMRKITFVQAEEYLAHSVQHLNNKYSKQMEILQNSVVPREVYSTGEIIIECLRVSRNNVENEYVLNSVDRLIYAIEGLINPFDSFRYTNLEPLMAFLTIKENGIYENVFTVNGFNYVFKGHEDYFRELKATNSVSLASLEWYKKILVEFSTLLFFVFSNNSYGSITYQFVYCLGQAHWAFLEMTPVKFSNFQNLVSRCHKDYQVGKYCIDARYIFTDSNFSQSKTIFADQASCISAALKSSNTTLIDCCFKNNYQQMYKS